MLKSHYQRIRRNDRQKVVKSRKPARTSDYYVRVVLTLLQSLHRPRFPRNNDEQVNKPLVALPISPKNMSKPQGKAGPSKPYGRPQKPIHKTVDLLKKNQTAAAKGKGKENGVLGNVMSLVDGKSFNSCCQMAGMLIGGVQR